MKFSPFLHPLEDVLLPRQGEICEADSELRRLPSLRRFASRISRNFTRFFSLCASDLPSLA